MLNLSGWRERGFYGQSYRVKQDICAGDLASRIGKTLEHEIAVQEHQFARNGVRTCIGAGRFLGSHRLAITCRSGGQDIEEVVEADKVLIAVGTAPHRPASIPFNDSNVLDSDDFIRAPRVPRSLAVVGAGVIGLEYATIFSALDVPVTLIEPRGNFLEFMDREIVDHLVHLMRDRGMALRIGGEVRQVRFAADGSPVCMLSDGRQVASEVVLFTAGRVGATAGLSLEACGLAADSRGHIMGIASGMLKLIVDIATRRVLGVHIIGEGATELVHIGQAVINLGGTIDYFIDNSFNYPTLAEAYKVAALDAWNRLRQHGGVVVEFEVTKADRDAA